MDRFSGRLDDGARLSRSVRAAGERMVRVDPDVPAVPGAVSPVAPASRSGPIIAPSRLPRVVAAAARSADAARLLDLAGAVQQRADRALGPARVSVPALPAGADAAAGVRQGRPPRAGAAGGARAMVVAGAGVPGRVPSRPERDQRQRHRRRVRRGDRRGSAAAGQAAVRRLAGRQRDGGHLRAGELLRLRPVPRRVRLEWQLGSVPAAHAAAILFDLLTLLGLFLLGRRIRGPTLGIVLAYAWAAYPFTLYALSSNTNDALVAMLLVLTLLVITSPPARGVGAALAGFAKFAPLALGPLFMRGIDSEFRKRSVIGYTMAFGITGLVVMVPVVLGGNLSRFWRDTLTYQAGRGSPFSIWGLWGGLGFEQHLVQGAAVALAIAVAFVPRRRDLVQVAALGAAVLITLQLGITHWFYLYIVWFFPLVIFALLAAYPERAPPPAVPLEVPGRVPAAAAG